MPVERSKRQVSCFASNLENQAVGKTDCRLALEVFERCADDVGILNRCRGG